MSLHVLSPSELLLGLHVHVAYINTNDNVIEKFQLPEEKPVKMENADDQEPVMLPPGIQNMAVSPDHNLIALSTRQKYLYVYKVDSRRPFVLSEVAKTTVTRVSNRMRFSACSTELLVADKTGDCFLWKFQDDKVLIPICGHLSMVMDVFFNDDRSALITCDRDEKIRVTSFPDNHNILAYCMGHTEYVSQMDLLPHNPQDYLVSISGDQTLRFWNYKQGKEVFQLPLSGSGALMTSWKSPSDTNASVIACSIYKSNILQVYEVQTSSTGELKMKSLKHVEIQPHTHFKALDHCEDGSLVTLTINKGDGEEGKLTPRVEILKFNEEERNYVPEDVSTVNNLLAKEFSDLDPNTEDKDEVAVLFKKRVNNIVHYHERKRKRIEERSK